MEEFIKKHLGYNTPQWIIDDCVTMLKEWDRQKISVRDNQLITSNGTHKFCDCPCPKGQNEEKFGKVLCDHCGDFIKNN